uniref:Uncharacterized protein n=1 Tax=Steinernema glaseri TaxID=37863 RepID=A0A1I7YI05_9BILA
MKGASSEWNGVTRQQKQLLFTNNAAARTLCATSRSPSRSTLLPVPGDLARFPKQPRASSFRLLALRSAYLAASVFELAFFSEEPGTRRSTRDVSIVVFGTRCAFTASTSGLFDPQQPMQMHQMYQSPQMGLMTPTSSTGALQWSGISPPPEYGMCHPQQQSQMMFEPQHRHQPQQHLGAALGGQAPPALQVVPEQGKANKKRKTPNGMIDRPPKQPFMNPAMGFQASPMYPQTNSVPSGHYSSQPSTPMPNHLSPYNCYDGQNNAPNGWSNGSQRPPSRSELIRMELQRTVQARKASASPNSLPPNIMSPQDMGAPRFTAPSNMSPVMMSPQSMMQPTPQSLQQQPTPPATYHPSGDFSGYGGLGDDPVTGGVFPSDQQLCNSASISNLTTAEYFDFNLGNGGFDMENETTQRLVQKLLS